MLQIIDKPKIAILSEDGTNVKYYLYSAPSYNDEEGLVLADFDYFANYKPDCLYNPELSEEDCDCIMCRFYKKNIYNEQELALIPNNEGLCIYHAKLNPEVLAQTRKTSLFAILEKNYVGWVRAEHLNVAVSFDRVILGEGIECEVFNLVKRDSAKPPELKRKAKFLESILKSRSIITSGRPSGKDFIEYFLDELTLQF